MAAKRATPAPGKVIKFLIREYLDRWMMIALKRLIKGGLPEDFSEGLRREFPNH